jgi:two-component system chemotaxis response regulator CheY
MTAKFNATVLLVEDESKERKRLRKLLESIGLRTVDVGNGKSAVKQLSENPFDLVCLDLMLPEVSGYQVCEFIRSSARLKHIPVLVVSGRSLPEDRAHAEKAGASAYLIKPFNAKSFLDRVTALLNAEVRPEETAK